MEQIGRARNCPLTLDPSPPLTPPHSLIRYSLLAIAPCCGGPTVTQRIPRKARYTFPVARIGWPRCCASCKSAVTRRILTKVESTYKIRFHLCRSDGARRHSVPELEKCSRNLLLWRRKFCSSDGIEEPWQSAEPLTPMLPRLRPHQRPPMCGVPMPGFQKLEDNACRCCIRRSRSVRTRSRIDSRCRP